MGGVRPRRVGARSLAVGLLVLVAVARPRRRCRRSIARETVLERARRPLALPARRRPARSQRRAAGNDLPARARAAVRHAHAERDDPGAGRRAGPGGRAAARRVRRIAWRNLLRGRRLVTFDQRGTRPARSARCARRSRGGPDSARIARRAARRGGAARQRIGGGREDSTTADSVAGVEAVRRRARRRQAILCGTSYGTKVALDYAAAYPQTRRPAAARLGRAAEGTDRRAPDHRLDPRVLRTLCAGRGCPFTPSARPTSARSRRGWRARRCAAAGSTATAVPGRRRSPARASSALRRPRPVPARRAAGRRAENRCACKRTVGSNPTLSASQVDFKR